MNHAGHHTRAASVAKEPASRAVADPIANALKSMTRCYTAYSFRAREIWGEVSVPGSVSTMGIRDELRTLAAKIDAIDVAHKESLRERDRLARQALEEGVGFNELQRILGLSPRGLSLVLSRTEKP